MIISKSNLLCSEITKHDKIPALNNVVLEPDGSTVGSNGKAMLLVGPVSEQVQQAFPLKGGLADERIVVGEETAKEVLKNIPRDTRFGGVLEHCDVREDAERTENVNFSITDGKRTRYIVGKKYDRQYIDYKSILSRVFKSKIDARVVVNLKRLISLLVTIDKCCPDSSGNQAVYIEFSQDNDVLIRSANAKTGQRLIGIMQSYKGAEGQWLETDKWERSLNDVDSVATDDKLAAGSRSDLSFARIKSKQTNNPKPVSGKIPKPSKPIV